MNRKQAKGVTSRTLRMKQRIINSAKLRTNRLSWLFILGVNNSGTTLLEDLLGRHAGIAKLPGEGQRLTRALFSPVRLKVRRLWTEKVESFRRFPGRGDALLTARVKWDWLGLYPVGGRTRFLMEKSPPNSVRGPWLQHHFKPASFVALTRSPFAVAEGIRRREGHSIERAARHWTVANRIMIDDLDRLDRHLLLSYEDLCADPSRQMDRVTRFLGIDSYEDEWLDGTFSIHNAKERPSSIINFNEASHEALSSDDIRRIEDIAGDVMNRLGYDSITG